MNVKITWEKVKKQFQREWALLRTNPFYETNCITNFDIATQQLNHQLIKIR